MKDYHKREFLEDSGLKAIESKVDDDGYMASMSLSMTDSSDDVVFSVSIFTKDANKEDRANDIKEVKEFAAVLFKIREYCNDMLLKCDEALDELQS